jgi:hypothetical protein
MTVFRVRQWATGIKVDPIKIQRTQVARERSRASYTAFANELRAYGWDENHIKPMLEANWNESLLRRVEHKKNRGLHASNPITLN